ncbi:MAG: ATP-binding cassette domain-containing protein [Planctomycetaceae bacterium]|nr:ATP-binding cassette domain-containing protein [Planctomycetaceae bacterium]
MIELRNICLRAGDFQLEQISFTVPQGAYAVLMGRTGRGKTTILEAICGLRGVMSGKILLSGIDVTLAMPAQRNIGYVPQDLALFPTMTVREHLEFAPRIRGRSRPWIEQQVNRLAGVLGIEPLLKRSIRGLSGGESQRVALGRALSFEPTVLLLDEPLSALDSATREEIQQLLREVQRSTGVTTLHVTHNQKEAESLADRLLILDNGAITIEERTDADDHLSP